MTVFFSPHQDDETLFAAFTLIRERPLVVVCFPSDPAYGDTATRLSETRAAVEILGAGPVEQWTGGDLEAQMRVLDRQVHPVRVWAPDIETSHPEHLAVHMAARHVFGDRLITYHTYIDGEKVTSPYVVPFEPAWVAQKLRALCRYQTQLQHPRAHRFFLNDLFEYLGEGV